MPTHVRKGDLVMVIAGKNRKQTGKVLRVLPDKSRVLVEGVNVRKRHVRPTQASPQGQIISKEMPIHISNVLPVADGKASRVRFRVNPDGSKVRLAAENNEVIGQPLRKARD